MQPATTNALENTDNAALHKAAVSVADVSKCYSIYNRPVDRLKEILSRNKRSYHKEFWALRDISLQFEAGKTTALLGPNGSGKSTLLQIIADVLQPTTGEVEVNGRLTAILELGAGFQMDHTGRENVLLNGMILGIPQDEMAARMDDIAAFAEIGDFFDQPVKTYSSGMTVRLAFAAAINVDPEILLVDEALAVGDQRFQQKCVERIEAMQELGKTIIFVSHDIGAVKRFCNKAVLLNGGRIVDYGPALDVVDQYEDLMQHHEQIAAKKFDVPTAIV